MPNKVTFAGYGNGFLNKFLKLDEGHSQVVEILEYLFHDTRALFGCSLLVLFCLVWFESRILA